ncbi:hypothetical protein N7462_006691 [Penicillium macrosclerotiorum]|uniref:uncharacterized protein n=1 Tax=Penicillium macrosclerotiorum TaxID=303699 RepID=UPI002547FE6C|nr:uncharacterized protein N7462_006691 [Penicillium macrosclerotiorum]KAJ5683526.1 hypothetical protein N7462_006691 [Penicillium macrosclerotiorum]
METCREDDLLDDLRPSWSPSSCSANAHTPGTSPGRMRVEHGMFGGEPVTPLNLGAVDGSRRRQTCLDLCWPRRSEGQKHSTSQIDRLPILLSAIPHLQSPGAEKCGVQLGRTETAVFI